MDSTVLGSIAVVVGVLVMFWDAARVHGLSPRFPLKFGIIIREAVTGVVLLILLPAGEKLTNHYWGDRGEALFRYSFFGLLFLAAVVVSLWRWVARKRANAV